MPLSCLFKKPSFTLCHYVYYTLYEYILLYHSTVYYTNTISLKIKVNLGLEESINTYDTRKKPKVFQLLKITRKANQVTNNGKHSLKLLIALTSPSIVLIKRWVGDAPPH